MQQQQQQSGNYDLLAVFGDEIKAEAAESKLHKEGFGNDEVFRLASSMVRGGEFREHGPNRDRSAVFLQTRRAGPNPVIIVLFAVLFGLILGVLLLLAHLVFAALAEPLSAIIGAIVGIMLGAAIGFMRRGPVRGAIGQDVSKIQSASNKPAAGDLTVVAVRLPDPDNLPRKSRARAILLNNGGKIDRSVGRSS